MKKETPHINIHCGKDIHVIPVSFIEGVISGEMDFTQQVNWKELLAVILQEWLSGFSRG